jgi:hypothetical protein
MDKYSAALTQTLTTELTRPAPPEVLAMAAAIRHRHGSAVAAILFYGSCLRNPQMDGGVLDFYVVVDSYRTAYTVRLLRWLNALLPPNVFYLEVQGKTKTIRAKYAVISSRDFSHGASLHSLHAIVWGRFCQPALLAYARDEQARALIVQSARQAVLTMVSRMTGLLPPQFRAAELWQQGFRETYGTELRPERTETIYSLYQAAPERYDGMTRDALRILEQQGYLHLQTESPTFRVTVAPQQRWQTWLQWRIRRPVAKALYAVRLLKSAATFGDWLPYVLWKLQRHSGERIELSERQRRHPLIWGWPIVLRLLLRRGLR